MKALYYDCFAGISGDMNLGALLDLGVDREYLIQELNKLLIVDEFSLTIKTDKKMGITGTKVDVLLKEHFYEHIEGHTHEHSHEHTHGHNHEHSHEHIQGHTHEHSHEHTHGHNHEHSNEHSHEHTQNYSHEHAHKHIYDHSQEDTHSRNSEQEHAHVGNAHTHKHSHEHRNLRMINELIDKSQLNSNVKKISKDIFLCIAKAEAKVHGMPVEEVHFHEVGAVDSIVDIVGAAICLDFLNVDRILSSTVELGSGFVRCAHGMIPVPAPATVEILHEVPTHIGRVTSEATTPTGAAILKTMVDAFVDNIEFKIVKTGYGLGTKDFSIPNVLRVFLLEIDEEEKDYINEDNFILETNIDDMNPEIISYIEDKLFQQGALDVYKTPITMKKGRMATKISVLTDSSNVAKVERILLHETSTFGIRKYRVQKKMFQRSIQNINTKYGDIPVKLALYKGETIKYKIEYEAAKKLSIEHNVPIQEVYCEAQKICNREGIINLDSNQ
ncbi:nickel pincer cofactor biosynthesis protein LarC [Mobilitalea sibirica]|uniref:Pyridinium-3,5-bisthiocarboxylic acid mononucleotide nickel insertion protein n=1 Tax=Mobilitalea sibirica TaxID=1462919 RepID=A0A8J7KS38_9FIRM|nr:nickel pincer cofactor biosynthesis protein LarC [Mobilitalea sibirica]MBH1939921.1 nickel pincer cofactor biosynthesis protein LarC [Mobilitalea sibirica]